MLTEAGIPGSDDWYAMELLTELGQGFTRLGTLRQYREGDAPVPDEASPEMREAYRRVVKRARLHMADLIVGAKTSRQKVVGFRTAAVGDDLGDRNAWANWKRSQMQVQVRDFFDDAGHYGTAYLTVTGGPEPLFLRSNGWTTRTRQSALRPLLADAGVTIGYDPINKANLFTLFRPGYIRQAYLPSQVDIVPNNGQAWRPNTDWTWVSDPQLTNSQDCAIVRYDAPDAMGFYEKHLDSVDRVNDTIKDRLVIVAMQSFRQRAIDGDLPENYPAGHERAGERIDYNSIFKAGPAALWMLPVGAKVWESQVTDVTPILAAAKDDMKNLAAVTGTPLYVLSPDAVTGSAEGASLVRETANFSVEDLNERAAVTFALGQSLMFQAQGDLVRADAAEVETIWASVDRSSISERASAAAQAKAGGATQRYIDEKVFGLTPSEMAQARQDRDEEALLAPIAPTAPAPA